MSTKNGTVLKNGKARAPRPDGRSRRKVRVAILGVGNVEKRPVVIDDAIAIRPMAYLSLGYDHRIIDGAVADQFMSHVKKTLEQWSDD